MVRQDGEAVLRKRRAQDVAQKAGAGIVVDGTRTGLGMQVETAVLHREVADDLGAATCGEDHGLALALGGARGRRARRSRVGQGQGGQALGPAGAGNPATAAAASCASTGSLAAKESSTSNASGLNRTTPRRSSALSTRAFVI